MLPNNPFRWLYLVVIVSLFINFLVLVMLLFVLWFLLMVLIYYFFSSSFRLLEPRVFRKLLFCALGVGMRCAYILPSPKTPLVEFNWIVVVVVCCLITKQLSSKHTPTVILLREWTFPSKSFNFYAAIM